MKRILILGISLCLILVGCNEKPIAVSQHERSQTANVTVKEFVVDNHPHEYIIYSPGTGTAMTHLPECKYCKNMSTQ